MSAGTLGYYEVLYDEGVRMPGILSAGTLGYHKVLYDEGMWDQVNMVKWHPVRRDSWLSQSTV